MYELHDIVIVDNKRIGTIIYVYPNGHYEIEYSDNEYETVRENRISSYK